MNLPVPIVSVETGPQFATDINNCMSLLDQHNHTSGYGVPIPTSGLNINADLPFGNNDAITLRSSRYTAQSSPLGVATDIGCTYVSGVDLYYNDVSGNQIRMTQSGGVAGTSGSIASLAAPASATYVSANSTFVWQSAVNTPATMDFGSAILRNISASSKGLTLNPPSAMATNYSLTLPSLPAATSFVTLDTSGNFSTLNQVQNAPPVGMIIASGSTSVPAGYLFCDGTAVSRTTYATLFTAISTAYGNGDNSTTFNVPDLRGVFLRGTSLTSSNDPGKTSRTASGSGGATGNNVGSLQVAATALPTASFTGTSSSDGAHNHTIAGRINDSSPNHSGGDPLLQQAAGSSAGTASSPTSTDGAHTHTTTITGGGDLETHPINVYVNYYIKF